VHILDLAGKRLKSYKPHMASIVDISMDATGDFVATASIDGTSLSFWDLGDPTLIGISFVHRRAGCDPLSVHSRVVRF
jgi:hypothetical protein